MKVNGQKPGTQEYDNQQVKPHNQPDFNGATWFPSYEFCSVHDLSPGDKIITAYRPCKGTSLSGYKLGSTSHPQFVTIGQEVQHGKEER